MSGSASQARPPALPSAPLDHPTPPGACDTHLHIFGAAHEFPFVPGNVEEPAPGSLEGWVGRLRTHMAALGLARGVLVHSVVYGEDMRATIAAREALGPDDFRGVALVHPDISACELDALHKAGMRGVRLNLSFTGALTLEGLETLAPRLADRGWHVLVNLPRYLERELSTISDRLAALPIPVMLDHHAYPDLPAGVEAPSFRHLLRLIEGGRFWVKLSAGYRLCEAPYEALDPFVRALAAANPERLTWASDWPHARYAGPMPDDAVLLNALIRQIPDETVRRRILIDNPAELYEFSH